MKSAKQGTAGYPEHSTPKGKEPGPSEPRVCVCVCTLKDKRKKKEPSEVLRREYSVVSGVYHVPLGAEEEVVILTPGGKCSLETGKWNSDNFPLAACKQPPHLETLAQTLPEPRA